MEIDSGKHVQPNPFVLRRVPYGRAHSEKIQFFVNIDCTTTTVGFIRNFDHCCSPGSPCKKSSAFFVNHCKYYRIAVDSGQTFRPECFDKIFGPNLMSRAHIYMEMLKVPIFLFSSHDVLRALQVFSTSFLILNGL